MIGMFAAGVVGYYIGLYTFLWSQLYTPHKRIKDKIEIFIFKQFGHQSIFF